MGNFRPVPETDRGEAHRILEYAFAPEGGPPTGEQAGEWPPSLFEQRGLYVDGTLVSACKLYTLDARVRGQFTTIGGLGAVSTAPEHRGEGYARELCREALAEYRDDVGLVALWPMSTPFYGRMGWGTANKYNHYELPPGALPAHDAEGSLCPLSADDWRRLRRVETAYGEGIALSVRRSESWWRERTLADWDGGGTPYCYGYERDGTLEGYVVYTVEDDRTPTLSVDDLAHTDEEAHRALLDFLGAHGAQIERVVLRRSTASDLLDRVTDPAAVQCSVEAGPMVRLTDPSYLEEMAWPETDLDCTLAVSDPLLDANDGLYRVSVTGGTASVQRVGDGTGSTSADVTVDVATLSQLAVGTYGVDDARWLGGLHLADESLRESLAALFRSQPVCLREFF